jgi:hypothetical protein
MLGRGERRPRGFAHSRQEKSFPSNLLLYLIDTSPIFKQRGLFDP